MDLFNWIETVGLELNTSNFSDEELRKFCVAVIKIILNNIDQTYLTFFKCHKISVLHEFLRRNYRFMKNHQKLIKAWLSKLKDTLNELNDHPGLEIYADHFQSCICQCLRYSPKLENCSIEGIDMEYLKNSTHTTRPGCIYMEYSEVMNILTSKPLEMIKVEIKNRDHGKLTKSIDDTISKDFDIVERTSFGDDDFINGVYLCKEKKTNHQYMIKYMHVFDYEESFYQKCSQDPAFVKTYSFDKIKIEDLEPSHVCDGYIAFWVMEYIESDTISEIFLNEEENNELERILKDLHSRGLYHGDIHDTNIIYRMKNGKKEFVLIDPMYQEKWSFEECCRKDLCDLQRYI